MSSAEESPQERPIRRPACGEADLVLTLPAVVDSVARARRAVIEHLEGSGAGARVLEHVALAISEACTNVVLHAYRSPPAGDFEVEVLIRDALLHVWVSDRGVGLRPRVDSPGMGIGLQVIGTLTEAVTITSEGTGTTLAMVFSLRG